jgi:flagellar hook assembly protein FlgD
MRKIILLVLLNALFFTAKSQKPEIVSIKAEGDTVMRFTVTTQSYGGQYNPKHVMAIWITDQNDVFKRTLRLAGGTYKVHLVKWNQMSSGNTIDAITGATLTSHQSHTAIWNGKDKNGNLLPDGNYKVYIEFTEDNSAQPTKPDGPWVAFPFTKGVIETQNPSDVYFTYNSQNKLVFKNLTLQTYGTTSVEQVLSGGKVEIYPNPVKDILQIRISLPEAKNLNVSIFSVDGKLVKQFSSQKYESGEHIFIWYPEAENIKSGTYFVNIASGKKLFIYKILKQ